MVITITALCTLTFSLLLTIGRCSLLLSGSPDSYALYPPWTPNSSPLTLEFSTTSPSGLLLYMDAENYFYELKLVDSTLRLRYNIGSGTKVLTVGTHLNNGLWHRVQIVKTTFNTKLMVDGFTGVSRSDSDVSDVYFENVYVGGLPTAWNSRLDELALPSVVFEPKFSGGVRNIGYGGRSVTVIEWKGLLSNPPHSSCDRYDPCLHGGYCISTDNGPLCDCSLIDYEGVVCEREKPPASAHFNSKSYIYLKLNQGLISAQDEIELLFKTRLANGLIFYAGDNVDYISIYLVAGHLTISINLGNGPLETLIGPNHLKFNDNQWHSVVVKRKTQEMSKTTSLCHVTTILDSIHYDRWTLSGQFSLLSSNYITLGGWTNNTKELYHHGFNGCLRKVTYKADTLVLNLIELARNGNQLIKIHGDVSFDCVENQFEAKKGLLIGPGYHTQVTTSSIITLTHPNSYVTLETQLATPTTIQFSFRTNEPNGILLQSTTFVLELVSGNLFLLLGNLYTQVSEDTVVDSKWHTIHMSKTKRAGFIKVDNVTIDFNSDVALGNDLVISGVNERSWASNMGYSYIGCFGDLSINSERVNLNAIIVQQDEATLRPHCPPGSSGFCLSNPCLNNGKCIDGWNRFICDCSHTNFTGHNCHLPNNVLTFNGFNTVNLEWTGVFQAEEVKLRFRSIKIHGNILLLKSTTSQDFFLMSLDFTRLKIEVNINGREKFLSTGSNLNDNQWHLVKYTRLGNSIRLQIDNEPSINGELSIKNITASYNSLQVSPPAQPFIGHISQLLVNNFNMLTNLNLFNHTIPPVDLEVIAPVTLTSYLKLPQLNVYSAIDLSFKLITADHNALILYNGGYDHILLELVNGYVEYSYKYTHGDLKITSSVFVSDGKWHRIVVKKLKGVDLLIVDNEVNKREALGGVIKLKGVLYIGGLPNDLLLPSMQRTSGFAGCLANTQLGDIVDLTQENLGSNGILKGCHEPTCTESTCTGTCANNECNCELTSMKGKFCNESDVEYFFNSTVLIYTVPTPRSSKEDKISFKLKSAKSNGALIQFVSALDNNDFIQVELSSGLLSIRSSIDSVKTTLTHPTKLTNDWHLINILRNGGNWTIKVDNGLEIWKNPGGTTPSIFRDLNQILIGGKFSNGPRKKARIYEPFVGSMSGIIINKVNLLQLYEHSNSQVQLIGNPFSYNYNDLMMKAPASSHQPIEKASDDLISSGLVTCPIDEDDCVPPPGGGDELITPIYIPNYSTFKPSVPCDDEDCVSSSGDGPPGANGWFTTTSDNIITSHTPNYYLPGITTGIIYPNSTGGGGTGEYESSSQDPSTTAKHQTPEVIPPVITWSPEWFDHKTEPTTKSTPHVVVATPELNPFKAPTTPSIPPQVTNRLFDWEKDATNPTQRTDPKINDPKNSFTAEASESTLVIIIIIALLLIIIVCILIIFFICKRKDDSLFKMESSVIDYGGAGGGGRIGTGAGGGGRFGKGAGTGVKEWYV